MDLLSVSTGVSSPNFGHSLVSDRKNSSRSRKSSALDDSRQSVENSTGGDGFSVNFDGYDPEVEAKIIKKEALKPRSIKFFTMFRYATPLDIILIILGVIFSFVTVLTLPFLVYRHGLFYRVATEISRNCLNKTAPFGDTEGYIHVAIGLHFGCLFLSHICFMQSAKRQVHALRSAYFLGILKKDSSWFDNYIDRNLARRMTQDISEIRNGLGENWAKLIYLTVSTILFSCLTFYLDHKLALIAVVMDCVYAYIAYLKLSFEENINASEQEQYAQADFCVETSLSSIRCTQIYMGEEREFLKYSQALVPPWNFRQQVLQLSTVCSFSWLFLFICLPAFLLSSHATASGNSSIQTRNPVYDTDSTYECESMGVNVTRESCPYKPWDLPPSPDFSRNFVIFLCCLFAAINSANLTLIGDRIRRAKLRAAKVYFIIDWNCRIDNLSTEGRIPRAVGIGKLELSNCIFKYPRKPDTLILKYVSIFIYPGQMVTILGPSGSGKSTVLRALLRLYDVSYGKAKFDGFPVQVLNVGWLRSQFGVIPQNPVVFSATIQENVRLGKWSASIEEVIEVCKIVQIHNEIMELKDGYETMVGLQTNVKLTPIQLKKLSVARVLLQNPRVFLFDEVITDIDGDFEKILLTLFEELREKHTILLTTSRVNSIVKTCDVIFALEDGKVMEQGNHEDMMATKKFYFHYFKKSSKRKSGTLMTRSQYTNHKYADAIERKHRFNDRGRKKLEIEYTANNHSIINKFEFTNEGARWVPPRSTGGFNYFSYYSFFESNGYYFRRQVQNTLLLDREKRQKLKAPEKKDGILKRKKKTSSKSSRENSDGSNYSAPGAESILKFTTGNEDVQVIKKFSEEEFKTEVLSPDFDLPGQVSERFKEGKEIHVVGGDHLRYYCGCTVNSSPDCDSLKSEDSYAFWSAYVDNLQAALEFQKRVRCPALFSVALFIWPYLLFALVTATLYGIFESEALAIRRFLHRDSLGNSDLNVSNDVRKGFLWLFCTLILAFVQETVLGFGHYKMSNKLRRYVYKYLLYQETEFWDFSENDIGFLRDSLAADVPLVHITLISFVTTTAQSVTQIVYTLYFAMREEEYIQEIIIVIPIFTFFLVCCYLAARLQYDYTVFASSFFKGTRDLEIDVVTNIRQVMMLGLEDHFLARHKNDLNKIYCIYVNPLIIVRSFVFAMARSTFFFHYHIWWALSRKTCIGAPPDVSNFIGVGDLFYFLLVPVAYSYARIPNYRDTCASASLIVSARKFFKEKAARDKTLKVLDYSPTQDPPHIRANDLKFAYPTVPEQIALKQVTIDIPPNSYVAVFGQANSGKHALIEVLMGLYEPTEGTVTLDGIDYKDLTKASLRKVFGLVEQDPTFLYASIAENIAYGDPTREVTMAEIIEAAKLAHIHDLIEEMQHKYDTIIVDLPMDSPATFCFRQRLAAAREFIHNPKVLFVDQATSSLDQHNYELLTDTLTKLREGRTYFITSQRIEPIRQADIIFVLSNGRIVEQGNDAQLLKKKGRYYKMYKQQRQLEAQSIKL